MGHNAYLALLRENREYRCLWGAFVVSLLGDWFNLLASATIVGRLGGSGSSMGTLFAIRTLASFAASPLGGILADRLDRRGLLIATDLLRGVVVLGFLAVDGPEDLALMYGLTALQLFLGGLYVPANNALLPNLVTPAQLPVANALGSMTWSSMMALGTALGGFFAGSFGTRAAFLVDALSFAVSALVLTGIRPRGPAQAEGPGGAAGLVAVWGEGLTYLRGRADLLPVVGLKPLMVLTSYGGLQVVQTHLARKVFVVGVDGATSLGILFSALGVGTLLGPLVGRHLAGDRDAPVARAIAFGFGGAALALGAAAALPGLPLTALLLMAQAAGVGLVWVFSNLILMRRLPDRVRGRVLAIEFGLITLASAASALAAGRALDHPALGPAGTLRLMALATLGAAGLWIRAIPRCLAVPEPAAPAP